MVPGRWNTLNSSGYSSLPHSQVRRQFQQNISRCQTRSSLVPQTTMAEDIPKSSIGGLCMKTIQLACKVPSTSWCWWCPKKHWNRWTHFKFRPRYRKACVKLDTPSEECSYPFVKSLHNRTFKHREAGIIDFGLASVEQVNAQVNLIRCYNYLSKWWYSTYIYPKA